ncbi:MAG: hypothetical protein H9917_01310 [Candidatus Oceanisphaera merdipullorum]|nr:hypothetical protein [Candidatus Oceanisphaera merdipullorum]
MNKQNVLIKRAYDKFEKSLKKTRKKDICMISECKEKAILSHSQQRNGQLKHICCENKKVYALRDSMVKTFDINSGKMKFKFIETPISKASTYLGLCNHHDTKLFKEIEKQKLGEISSSEASAFYYRAMSYESYRKERELERTRFLYDEIKETLLPEQAFGLYRFFRWHENNFNNSVLTQLGEIDEIIKLKKYDELEFIQIVLDKNIGVSCCSMVNMHLDRYFEFLDEYPSSIPAFSFNLLPFENESHIILCWLKKNSCFMTEVTEYIKSHLEHFLNKVIFCESEDICVNPTLWEGIDSKIKERIYFNLNHTIQRGTLAWDDVPIVIKI